MLFVFFCILLFHVKQSDFFARIDFAGAFVFYACYLSLLRVSLRICVVFAVVVLFFSFRRIASEFASSDEVPRKRTVYSVHSLSFSPFCTANGLLFYCKRFLRSVSAFATATISLYGLHGVFAMLTPIYRIFLCLSRRLFVFCACALLPSDYCSSSRFRTLFLHNRF